MANDRTAREDKSEPAELVSDLIGSVSGGLKDLSEDTGRKLREILEAKQQQ